MHFRGSPTWFNTLIDPMTDIAKLKIVTKMHTQVNIMKIYKLLEIFNECLMNPSKY